jgi:hypothetical protein
MHGAPELRPLREPETTRVYLRGNPSCGSDQPAATSAPTPLQAEQRREHIGGGGAADIRLVQSDCEKKPPRTDEFRPPPGLTHEIGILSKLRAI